MLTAAEVRDGVRCPRCEVRLERRFVAVVIASRHCPHCGRRVLDDPDDPGRPTLAVADLAALREQAVRTQSRLAWPVLGGLVTWLVVLLVIALFRDTIRDALAPVADPEAVKTVMGWLVLGGLTGLLGWVFVVGHRCEKAAGRCPHCAAGMWGRVGLLTATGNCGRCGKRVVDRPPTEPDDPTLPTVAEAVADGRRRERTARLWMFAGVGLTVALMVGSGLFAEWYGGPGPFWDEVERRYGAVAAVCLQMGVGLVAILPAAGGMIRGARRLGAGGMVRCRHCEHAVGGAGVTVASKCCSKCGRRVLADVTPGG